MGFIVLNSSPASWKPTVESNSTNPASICLTSLSVPAQPGWIGSETPDRHQTPATAPYQANMRSLGQSNSADVSLVIPHTSYICTVTVLCSSSELL
jgi:hypothetical protein